MSNKFRPQGLPKAYIMKQRLAYGRSDNYNWQSRTKWYIANWGFNKCTIFNFHSRLHYLACHAPNPIRKQWGNAYKAFYKRHFGTDHGTIRYLNKYSCHSWM